MTVNKIVRRTHLLLAVFLMPWILMYALSTLAMHHRMLLTGEQQRVDPGYDVVQEEAFSLPEASRTDRDAAALDILRHLNMEGVHFVRGNLDEGPFTVVRDHPLRDYRITFDTQTELLKVERQRFGMVFVLEMLHRKRGFEQPYFLNDAWAVIVDLVIVAILAWAITGVWMWWTMAKTRRLGWICIVSGALLFVLFLSIL